MIALPLVASFALALASITPADGDAWRGQRPTPGPDATFTPPQVQTFTIDGTQLGVQLIERHDLPIVEMTLAINAGRMLDPKDKSGLWGVCVDLLDESTQRLDKNALEEKKADLAVRISASANRETSSVSLSVVKERLDPALALLAELLTAPGLRDADLERLRSRQIASVKQARVSAESVGGRVFGPVHWGPQHPFGGVVTEASLAKITRADCTDVAARFKPDNAQLFVSGDVTPAELQALFKQHFASWRGKAPKASKVDAPRPMKGRYFFVDVPGAAQSSVMIVHPGPLRTDKDYVANTLMATIYGGGFSSRLNMNLREKNGYTYGARGGLSYAKSAGIATSSSSIRTDVTEAALREFAKELAGMQAGRPTDAELVRERTGALLAYPALFASNGGAMNQAMDLWFYGLGFDEWQKFPAAMRTVDAAAVEAAAKRVLRPTDALVVVAGDGKVVKPALEALAKDKLFGGGDVVELDADGAPKK